MHFIHTYQPAKHALLTDGDNAVCAESAVSFYDVFWRIRPTLHPMGGYNFSSYVKTSAR